MDEYRALVRALAERGPIDVNRETGWDCGECSYFTRNLVEDFMNPANHERTCLWRRARALYPDAATDEDH